MLISRILFRKYHLFELYNGNIFFELYNLKHRKIEITKKKELCNGMSKTYKYMVRKIESENLKTYSNCIV